MQNTSTLSDFPRQSYDKLRYADTDRQGHLNNAVFSTFLETGRVELLYAADHRVLEADTSVVIAKLELDFVSELHWPGRVDIGTGVQRIGTSSLTLVQALFQEQRLVARSQSVIVQVDDHSGKSRPWTPGAKAILVQFLITS
ncbi:MAG: acyl-CoA thioesterase [Bacteroidetes bacterium]|nr:MAG: acyl-CoA thioesterase [Bacteroidota bacterium]